MKYILLLLIFLTFLSITSSKPINPDLGNGIYYVGVNDDNLRQFEGQYPVPHGIAYNSYIVIDEGTSEVAIIDTVDIKFKDEWLNNIKNCLKNLKPKYLIVQHMEPDHSACINGFKEVYPDVTVVSSKKAFNMMKNFYKDHHESNRKIVKEGDTIASVAMANKLNVQEFLLDLLSEIIQDYKPDGINLDYNSDI